MQENLSRYYIKSNKYSLRERQTKEHGKLYDVVFRVIDPLTMEEKQKWLRGFVTKTQAKEYYVKFVEDNCSLLKGNIGVIRKNNGKKEIAEPTVKDLLYIYYESIRNNNKDSVIYEKMKLFDLMIVPYFGDMRLCDIKKPVMVEWQEKQWSMANPKTGKYYAYKYLSKIRSYLSAFFNWCEMRYPDNFRNYLKEIPKPKKKQAKTEMKFWTRKEFERFIKVVDDETYKTLFTVLFFTGRRKGEVLALSPSDIHLPTVDFVKSVTRKTLDESTYQITSPKTDKPQKDLPVCKTVQKCLEEYLKTVDKDKAFLFGGDTPLTDTTLRRVFNRYIEKAKVPMIRIHDLRHSFVSMTYSLCHNFQVVADLIGDTLPVVLKTYAHLYQEDKYKAVEMIG